MICPRVGAKEMGQVADVGAGAGAEEEVVADQPSL